MSGFKEAAPARTHAAGAAWVAPVAAAHRVLVVDGWVKAAVALGYRLQALGCEVRTAHDEASALLGAAVLRPQLVLVDAGLLGDGRLPDLLRQLLPQQQPAIACLVPPVDDGGLAHGPPRGVDCCLPKPPSDAALQELLDGCGAPQPHAPPPPFMAPPRPGTARRGPAR